MEHDAILKLLRAPALLPEIYLDQFLSHPTFFPSSGINTYCPLVLVHLFISSQAGALSCFLQMHFSLICLTRKQNYPSP